MSIKSHYFYVGWYTHSVSLTMVWWMKLRGEKGQRINMTFSSLYFEAPILLLYSLSIKQNVYIRASRLKGLSDEFSVDRSHV